MANFDQKLPNWMGRLLAGKIAASLLWVVWCNYGGPADLVELSQAQSGGMPHFYTRWVRRKREVLKARLEWRVLAWSYRPKATRLNALLLKAQHIEEGDAPRTVITFDQEGFLRRQSILPCMNSKPLLPTDQEFTRSQDRSRLGVIVFNKNCTFIDCSCSSVNDCLLRQQQRRLYYVYLCRTKRCMMMDNNHSIWLLAMFHTVPLARTAATS